MVTSLSMHGGVSTNQRNITQNHTLCWIHYGRTVGLKIMRGHIRQNTESEQELTVTAF